MATPQAGGRRVKTALLTATFLTFAGSVFAQSCQSQATMSALAQSVQAQVAGDNVPECSLFNTSGSGGTCYPITLAPGDVTPGNGSVTDKFGNVWSLTPQAGEDGSGAWYGGPTLNGNVLAVGYVAAIRLLPSGLVALEEAKFSGWMVEPSSGANASDVSNWDVATGTSGWTFAGGDPGPGVGCGGTVEAASTEPVTEAAADPSAAAAPANTSSQPVAGGSLPPAVMPVCSTQVAGAITPGSGTLSDINGDTLAINPTDNNTATINGQPITPNGESSETSQMVLVDGQTFGQDQNTLQWFEMIAGPGGERSWAWQPVASLPTGDQAPVATTRWETAAAGGQQACASPATPATASASQSGCTNTPSGTVPDLMQTCADPAVLANASDAALCAEAQQALALQTQLSRQLVQAGVAPATTAAPAGPVCTGGTQQ